MNRGDSDMTRRFPEVATWGDAPGGSPHAVRPGRQPNEPELARVELQQERDSQSEQPPQRQQRWLLNLMLFVATVATVFLAGYAGSHSALERSWSIAAIFNLGAPFALPLLAILLFHEFGHYIAARIHGVPTSLPYFIPMPFNLFGTMGAVILMPARIRSAKAVLDIGAAGPLAGMVVAVPVLIYGLSLSEVAPQSTGSYIQEGQSLFYWSLKYLVHGSIPPGFDVYLHPTALAGWTGFFITFLNLVPFGQLDGGHVAFALLGNRHHRIARWVVHLPLLLVVYNIVAQSRQSLGNLSRGGVSELDFGYIFGTGPVTMWLVFWVLLLAMRRLAGAEHPPVDDEELGMGRKIIAASTLALFVLLFMPSPLAFYE